jgi:hypothetical protein
MTGPELTLLMAEENLRARMSIITDQAQEIHRLRDEIERLREALIAIVENAIEATDGNYWSTQMLVGLPRIQAGRAALRPSE